MSARATPSRRAQRGGFGIGFVVGLLVGLALALGVALYVTKVPVPFINKVPQRTAEQEAAEAERNRNWDPNAPLAGKPAARPASVPAPAPQAVPAPAARPEAAAPRAPGGRDPAAILSGQGDPAKESSAARSTKAGAEPFTYFVQAGAYGRADDAEQQRARLAMLGLQARVSEREQAGRTVYRVRVGPFERKDDADSAQSRLQAAGVEAALVRIER